MKKFILITGVGRSGTSLLANIIHKLGFSFSKINSKKYKKRFIGVPGHFEDITLGRAIHLWELAIYGNKKWETSFLIPHENKIRSPSPFKKILFKTGDYLIKKHLINNKKKKTFVLKRPNAIFWLWRICKIAKEINIPQPTVIFCDRNSLDIAHSTFEAQGTNYQDVIKAAESYKTQVKYLQQNKKKIVPNITTIDFEDYKKNPKNIAKKLSHILELPSDKIISTINKTYILKR